jgi:anaerobic selenocysteine-containing dehydrogenase
MQSPDRLTTPLQRAASGRHEPIDWTTAAELFCSRMRAVQDRHGADSVAFLSTGQIPTEEMALLGAFAKFEMGVVHGDGNTRQCMATSAVAHKESFGFDSPPFTYADFELSDVIVLVGSNLCIAHPIMWERIVRNPHNPTVVTIDPRRTETAAASGVHIQPRPGTDLFLLMAVARELIRMDAVDAEFVNTHTNGYDDWERTIERWTPGDAEAECGVAAEQIQELARIIASGQRVSLWWTMGVNQGHQAVRTAQAIINIALMTGNIGRPGTGANSITGQCNAMGSRVFANTTNLFGGRSFTDEAHRSAVATVLDIDVSKIPDRPSWAYDQILAGIDDGSIRALWIVATNTVHSWLDQDRVKARLSKLEFLVVQDLYGDTATAAIADLVLPAAGWGEKDGTFINAERRVGRIRRVMPPPGTARSDFEIFWLLARTWGSGPWLDRWSTPADAFSVIQALSAGRPCDMTGMDFDRLDETGMQWPFSATHQWDAERRLFADGQFFHSDGKARFVCDSADVGPTQPPETPNVEYPLVLLTGRHSSAQWHTGTRTDRSAQLRALSPPVDVIYVNELDAGERSIRSGDLCAVRSRRGTERYVAQVTSLVPAGQSFISMHDPRVNRLTAEIVDPHSRQPAAKQSCVNVVKVSSQPR